MKAAGLRVFAVVNPASAGGRTLHAWPKAAAALRAAGVSLDVHVTSGPGDATDAVRAVLRDGVERVVSVGGDGTLNEVVNGFFDERGNAIGQGAALAVIPSGSGGDFRRTAGIPIDPAGAARLVSAATAAHIDVGRIDYGDGSIRHFINIADCGLGGEVVARVNRNPHKGGGLRGSVVFLRESLAAMLSYHARRARIEIDGDVIDRDVESVVVANGQYFGGGMHVAPGARLDDGLFDVVVVDAMSRLRAVTSTPSLYRGTHIRRRGVVVRRARVVRVEHGTAPLLFDVEGEQIGATPATLTCLPRAIALCAAIGS